MKVAQFASYIDLSFIPAAYRPFYEVELARLRDGAQPLPWPLVRRVLEQEWNRAPESMFEHFCEDAAAAASIGQVHRAVLPGGRVVAVKVQYPGIRAAVAADLDAAAVLLRLVRRFAPGVDPHDIATELRARILQELDYRLEARQQAVFAQAYRGHPFIYVPDVVAELSTERVLVSDWVEGEGFDALRACGESERNRVGEIVFRFYLRSLHVCGAYNADPHPGNFIARADGSVAFVDFGAVTVPPADWLGPRLAIMRASTAGDPEALHRALAGAGYLDVDDDLPALLRGVVRQDGWMLEDRQLVLDVELLRQSLPLVTNLGSEINYLLRHGRVPGTELWLRRLHYSLLLVLGQLGVTANWGRIAREWLLDDEPETPLGEAEQRFFARADRAAA